MKLSKMKLLKLMSNKYVLYVVFILAILNVLKFLNDQDLDSVAVFALTTFLSSYFSKNMTVNLGLALIVSNCMACRNMFTMEGFKPDLTGEKQEKQKKKQKKQKTIKKRWRKI